MQNTAFEVAGYDADSPMIFHDATVSGTSAGAVGGNGFVDDFVIDALLGGVEPCVRDGAAVDPREQAASANAITMPITTR